jgi:hypothetical protein
MINYFNYFFITPVKSDINSALDSDSDINSAAPNVAPTVSFGPERSGQSNLIAEITLEPERISNGQVEECKDAELNDALTQKKNKVVRFCSYLAVLKKYAKCQKTVDLLDE